MSQVASLRMTVLVTIALFCGAVHADSAATSAATLLLQMNKAFANQDYDGTFTYFSGDEITSLRVVHKVVDGEQQERLVHLNGAPREILRHGDRVKCIVEPGDDIAVLEQSVPAGPFARAFVRDFDRLSGHYSVEQMGEGRIANRPAVRIAITPKDELRYGYRVWLDADTSLLLKSEMIDNQGERLEIFQFSELRVGSEVPTSALQSDEHSGSMISHLTLRSETEAVSEPVELDWRVSWMPPGFMMAANDIRTRPTNETVGSAMYTDGLVSFTVFVEAMPEGGAASMVSQMGPTVAITRGLMASEQNFLVTLVGEIPIATGQRIIESVAAR